jgi:hypothetical protein
MRKQTVHDVEDQELLPLQRDNIVQALFSESLQEDLMMMKKQQQQHERIRVKLIIRV